MHSFPLFTVRQFEATPCLQAATTNSYTQAAVGYTYIYAQTNSNPAGVFGQEPYQFHTSATLASNLNAFDVTLAVPGHSTVFLMTNTTQDFHIDDMYSNTTALEAAWPPGSYNMTINFSNASALPIGLDLSGVSQPSVPYITNFAATQAVNPAKPFTIGWNSYDAVYIQVTVGSAFKTADPLSPGSLTGSDTSVTIPANTLTNASGKYNVIVAFYNGDVASSSSTLHAFAYLASGTESELLVNTNIAASSLALANASRSGGVFSFNVLSAANASFTVQFSSSLDSSSSWQTLVATNSVSGTLHITDTRTGGPYFYRALSGS